MLRDVLILIKVPEFPLEAASLWGRRKKRCKEIKGIFPQLTERQPWRWDMNQEFLVTFCSDTARRWSQTHSASGIEATASLKQSWDTQSCLFSLF